MQYSIYILPEYESTHNLGYNEIKDLAINRYIYDETTNKEEFLKEFLTDLNDGVLSDLDWYYLADDVNGIILN